MNQNKLFQTLVSKEAAEFSGEAGEFRCLSLSAAKILAEMHDSELRSLEGGAPDFARPTSRLGTGWHAHYCSPPRSRRARRSSAEAAVADEFRDLA